MSLWVALKTKDFGWKSRSWETGFPKAKKKKKDYLRKKWLSVSDIYEKLIKK